MGETNGKRKIAGCITACLLVFLVLIIFLGYTVRKYADGIYQNIRESTTESVQALTSDRVKMLDKTLELLEIQAQTLAVNVSSPGLAVTADMLKTYADMDEDILHVVLFWVDGTAISSKGTMPEISTDDEAYRQVLAGKNGVTDTFLGEMGYEEVRVYAPVSRGGEVVGGVYIDLDAEVLRSAGKNPLYDSKGYSYILKQDGTILLAPSSYSYAQIYHNVREVFSASGSSQETVDAFMEALANGKSGNAVLDFSGEMQIICFQPSIVKEGWYYVSVLPLAFVENNGQTVIKLSSRMITLFAAVILAFVVFLTAIVFILLRGKWKKDINEGRVYKAISENIDTAIFIMDRQTGFIRHAFDNVYSILGIPKNQVQGNVFSQNWIARNGLPAGVGVMVRDVEKSGKPLKGEMQHVNPLQSSKVWLSVRVSPLNLKGRKEYMVAFTNITEEKRLMEQLHESMLEAQSASAAKSSFLANMSHDIRTPMNAITGMTDIAILSIGDQKRVLDCLHKISMSSRHLKGLINNILDMSKIESGKLSLNPDITLLPEVMENLLNIIRFQADAKNQRMLATVLNVEHETVICDAVRLNQVLLNILANAVKFTPEGGHIRCSVEELPSPQGNRYARYVFSIRDSGIGMSKEFQKMIFDAFAREKTDRIDKIEGSGLGMSISKWIVDQMGGTISVSSEPGKGSEFIVTVDFPIAAEQTEICTLPQGLSLLLVDGDGHSRSSAALTLDGLGFEVDAAPDLDNAKSCILQRHSVGERYAVILLSNIFSDAALLETVASLRQADTSSRILAAVGEYAEIREQVLEKGADDVISPLFFKSALSCGIARILSYAAEAVEIQSQDKPLDGKHILLAEDNELNREIAVELLATNGAIVDTAEDGQKCLERFWASAPGYYQIILMDIRMPVMNGYEATRRIRACGREDAQTIPILAVTADAFSEDIQAAKDAGMDGHISKPLDISLVIAEMKRRL